MGIWVYMEGELYLCANEWHGNLRRVKIVLGLKWEMMNILTFIENVDE